MRANIHILFYIASHFDVGSDKLDYKTESNI